MGWKIFFSLLFIILVILLLAVYWFIPLSTSEFIIKTKPSNFSIGNASASKQFYNNMRFPDKRISYKVGECTLQKKEDMLGAFEIIENKTVLDFYETDSNEEITVVCDSTTKVEEGLFIAGEGGPTNVTRAGEFNIITYGKILLFKHSTCPTPNIAIHELLHVLGFDHSANPNDIMYAVSRCGQSISQENIDTINTLYSIPSYPDLTFESVSAIMHGKYLNVNMSVRNNGFQTSPRSSIIISAGDNSIKEVSLENLEPGHGRLISLTNVWVSLVSVNELRFFIKGSSNELKKENNEVVLKLKK